MGNREATRGLLYLLDARGANRDQGRGFDLSRFFPSSETALRVAVG
jgi:hypothetical protein